MIKKIIILIIIFSSFFIYIWSNSLYAGILAKKVCEEWTDNLCSKDFIIEVNKISPWMEVKKKENGWSYTTKENINSTLWTIIQKLMIALWSISLLIMTIWAWYMILYVWQDELLTKWKSIFKSWIISLVVALSSYYIIALVRYILYN